MSEQVIYNGNSYFKNHNEMKIFAKKFNFWMHVCKWLTSEAIPEFTEDGSLQIVYDLNYNAYLPSKIESTWKISAGSLLIDESVFEQVRLILSTYGWKARFDNFYPDDNVKSIFIELTCFDNSTPKELSEHPEM